MEDYEMMDYESMDYGIEEYDKEPYYRNRRGDYRIVYGRRDRVGRIERGIVPFFKFLAAIVIFLTLVGMIG